MTVIVVTAVVGLGGYWITLVAAEPDMSSWFIRYALPAIVGVGFLVIVAVIWEGLDLMD